MRARELHERIVDHKPDRNLSDPAQTVALEELLPGVQHVPYAHVPFLDRMHALMGVADPLAITVEDYMARRDALFTAQPIVAVPFDRMVVTQPTVNRARVQQIVDDPATGGSKPQHFTRWDGRTFTMNGHHRVAAQLAAGDSSADGHLLDLDQQPAAAA